MKSFNLESIWHKILLKYKYKKNPPVLQNLINMCIYMYLLVYVHVSTNLLESQPMINQPTLEFFFLRNLDFVMVFVVLMVHLIHAQTRGMCKFLTICVCHTFVLLYNRIGEIMTYQTQIWTPVRRIFSLVVYQLSYLVPVSYIFWTPDILNPGSIFRGINILYDTSIRTARTKLNAAVWIK